MSSRSTCLALTAALVLGLTGTAHAQEAASLRTTLEFDKTHYDLHDTMRMTFTIKNVGGEAAERVRLALPPYPPMYDRWNWAPITAGGDGIRVEAGETRTIEITGGVADRVESTQTELTFSGYLDYTGRQANNDDGFSDTATITPTSGDLQGVVRTPDGTPLAGTEVTIWGARRQSASRTTDTEGRFLFEDAPGGQWKIGYRHPDGWVVPYGNGSVHTVVVRSHGANLDVRAERPISESLKAELMFDKTAYEGVGDKITITVTLTNTGDRPIRGVQALCRTYNSRNYLEVGPEWGSLAPPAGVNFWQGGSRSFTVVEHVTKGAAVAGEVRASCFFGPQPQHNDGLAEANARADVR